MMKAPAESQARNGWSKDLDSTLTLLKSKFWNKGRIFH